MPDPTVPTAQDLLDEASLGNALQEQYHAPPVAPEERSVLADIGVQTAVGAGLAVTNTAALALKPLAYLLGANPTQVSQEDDGSLKVFNSFELDAVAPKAKTLAGGLAGGLSQAVVGYLIPGGFASKAVGLTASKAPMLVKGAVQGFFGDFAAFGPHQGRLSDVLAPLGIPFVSLVADSLKSEEDDSELVGRLKGAIEGLGVGLTVEAALKAAKGIVKLRRVNAVAPEDKMLATKLLSEGTEDISKAIKESPAVAPSPEVHEAEVKPIVPEPKGTPKDRIITRIQEADPALSFDEASAVADVQHALAKYINPTQDADKTLESLFTYAGKSADVFPVGKEVKGATSFLDDGKAIITLYKSADFSTHVHETAHVVAKYLREDDKAILDDWVKSSDSGAWGKNAHEKFARGLERYLRDGVAPNEALKPMFDRIKGFMVNVYKKLRGSSVNVRIPENVRAVYDRLLSGVDHEKIKKAESVAITKEVAARAEVKISTEGASELANSLKGGTPLPQGAVLDHLTPALLAAHERNGTAEVAMAVAAKVNAAQPTGTQTLGTLAHASQELGKTPDQVVAKLREFVTNEKDLSEHIAAFDWHVQALHNEVKRLAGEAAKVDAKQDTLLEFLKRSHELEDMVGLQFHSQTILGRSVGAYRLHRGGIDGIQQALGEIKELHQDAEPILAAMGGAERVRKAAAKIAASHGAAHETAKEVGALTSAWNKAMEWYMNAILSGPKTHMVNIMSNTIQSVILPLERALGGFVVGKVTGKEAAMAEAKQGVLQLMGLTTALKESFNAGVGRWQGKAGIASSATPTELRGIQSPAIRKYFLVASRMLESEDEFFKQLNFRATAYAHLYEKATKQLNPEEWLGKEIDRLAKDPASFKEGLDMAKVATFTEDLPQGSLFHSVNALVNKHPLLRLVFPFVKTPSNIIRNVGRHVPGLGLLPLVHSDIRAAMRAPGGEKLVAQLVGRQLVGLGFTLGVAGLWAAHRITGTAPVDPEQRKAWIMAGNREFSVKVGNTWVEYKRLDPFATLIGAAADAMTAASELKHPGEAGKIVYKGLVQNITDKTYFKGLSDIVKAIDSPERWASVWASNVAGGFTPYSGATSQLTKSFTHTAYRMETLVDQLKARSLGLWTPEPRINIDGQPVEIGIDEGVSPIAITNDINDPALDELAKVPGGLRLEPSPKLGNVELTPKQQTQLATIQGTIVLGGKTMHEALNALVESSSYKKLPDLEDTPDNYQNQSPRVIQLRKIIDRYQSAARQQFLRDPEALNKVRQDKANKTAAKAGQFEKIKEIAQ